MTYMQWYHSPLGKILLTADGTRLTGSWFDGALYFARSLKTPYEEKNTPVLEKAKLWLSIYFSGGNPDFIVPFCFNGTDFQNEVWRILCTIPYGQTTCYGEIAQRIAAQRGIAHMSAQAVGNAVAHNEISIIIPCHRVIGSRGNLTGYAGGLDKKLRLLALEGALRDSAL